MRRAGHWLRRGIAAAFLFGAASPASALCGNGMASEDLTNECLLGAFQTTADPADRAAFQSLLTARLIAAGHDRSIGLGGRAPQPPLRATLRPVLDYSRNLNGGQMDTPLVLGGLSFIFDPARQRRAGLVGGAELGLSRRVLLGDGRRLDLAATATALHAPEEDLTQYHGHLAACPTWRIDRHWKLDGCLRILHQDLELQTDTAIVQSLGVTRYLRSPGGTGSTALTVGLERRRQDNLDQQTVRLSMERLLSRDFVGRLSFAAGRGAPGQFVIRRSLAAGLSGPIANRPATLWVSRTEEGGADLLGLPRADVTDRIGLDIQLHPRLAVVLGYEHRRSSIASFDESFPTLGLRLGGIDF